MLRTHMRGWMQLCTVCTVAVTWLAAPSAALPATHGPSSWTTTTPSHTVRGQHYVAHFVQLCALLMPTRPKPSQVVSTNSGVVRCFRFPAERSVKATLGCCCNPLPVQDSILQAALC
jgi:hypothetical protein